MTNLQILQNAYFEILVYINQYFINMLNFNNKKNNNDQNHKKQQRQLSEDKDNCRKENSATQCLLLLSQMQENHREQNKKKYMDYSHAEVTPWSCTQNKAKIGDCNKKIKSKTTILLQSCDENKCQDNERVDKRAKNIQTKDFRFSSNRKNSANKTRLIRRDSGSIKNSYSAIARYNDRTIQSKNIQNSQNQQCQQNKLRSYERCFQNYQKLSASSEKNPKQRLSVCKKYNKQNNPMQMITQFPVKGQKSLKKSKLNNQLAFINQFTYSILTPNTRMINSASGCKNQQTMTEESQFSQMFNSEFQIEQKDQNFLNKIKYRKDAPLKKISNEVPYKLQFQNIISNLNKSGSEYQKIKHKILENIKKESILHEQFINKSNINQSKKIIGKYFKQIQEKKSKNKNKGKTTSLTNNSVGGYHVINNYSNYGKNEVMDNSFYELNNPLTKNLYEKYKILLHKNK